MLCLVFYSGKVVWLGNLPTNEDELCYPCWKLSHLTEQHSVTPGPGAGAGYLQWHCQWDGPHCWSHGGFKASRCSCCRRQAAAHTAADAHVAAPRNCTPAATHGVHVSSWVLSGVRRAGAVDTRAGAVCSIRGLRAGLRAPLGECVGQHLFRRRFTQSYFQDLLSRIMNCKHCNSSEKKFGGCDDLRMLLAWTRNLYRILVGCHLRWPHQRKIRVQILKKWVL